MRTITTIGLDIAKSVFQVHGVDADGDVAHHVGFALRCTSAAGQSGIPDDAAGRQLTQPERSRTKPKWEFPRLCRGAAKV